MALIFVLSSRPDLPHPQKGWLHSLFGNSAHVAEYAVLAILWIRALGFSRRRAASAFALTMLYALSDEYHQSFVPGRHADPLDLVFDGIGAALGLLVVYWWKRRGKGERRKAA
jgi:VanZ family protein